MTTDRNSPNLATRALSQAIHDWLARWLADHPAGGDHGADLAATARRTLAAMRAEGYAGGDDGR